MRLRAILFILLNVTVNCNPSSGSEPDPQATLIVKVLTTTEPQEYVPLLIEEISFDETGTLEVGQTIRVTGASSLSFWTRAEVILVYENEGWVYSEFIRGWP